MVVLSRTNSHRGKITAIVQKAGTKNNGRILFGFKVSDQGFALSPKRRSGYGSQAEIVVEPGCSDNVLATAFAAKKFRGTGRHEPMLLTVEYEKGRVFHTPMGHGNYSQECVGFITVFQRGAEWAATGKVTIPVPEDFKRTESADIALPGGQP